MKYVSIWSTSAAGEPTISREHPKLEDTEARAVLQYLRSGHMLIRTTAREPDVLSDSEHLVVGLSSYTDGTYIWDDSLLYYVEHYRLSPNAEFLDHCRSLGFVAPTPSAEELAEARSLLGS